MKRHLLFILTAAIILNFYPVRTTAESPFDITGSNKEANFTDLPDDWSKEYILLCYTSGLMSGRSTDRFAPDGTVTIAEAVTVAARIRDIHWGGQGIFPADGLHWYDNAVNSAIEHGIITPDQFTNYEAYASRAEVASILANVMPETQYEKRNNITQLPDVGKCTEYYQDIFKLYNAGIISGNDVYGTFYPNRTITRKELSAILCRLVFQERRFTFELTEKPFGAANAYSSDYCLYIGEYPSYGVVEINGDFYYPLELLEDIGGYLIDNSLYDLKEEPYISFGDVWEAPKDIHIRESKAVKGLRTLLGTATPSDKVLTARTGSYGNPEVETALYSIDGKYFMLRLTDLLNITNVVVDEKKNEIRMFSNDYPVGSIALETDLAAQALDTMQDNPPEQRVKDIHDYIVNKLTYNPLIAEQSITEKQEKAVTEAISTAYDLYSYDINQTLSSGYGVCQDYAELFQYMCVLSGIPCEVVIGDARGNGHAWNRVFIGGKWSYVDCTWDDPIGSKPTLSYNYYMITADNLVKTHYWDDTDYPFPKEYDPSWEKLDTQNITSPDMFRKCLIAQMMQKVNPVKLRVTKSGGYGGMACIRAIPTDFMLIQGGYDKESKQYIYEVNYHSD